MTLRRLNDAQPPLSLASWNKLMAHKPHSTNEIDLFATSEGIGATLPESGLLGRLVERAGYVFAAGIVLAAAILLLEVFLRYILNRPTIWAHETTTFLCGIAFVFGGLFCASRNSHIRVVIVYDLLSPYWRRVMDVAISFVSFVACAFFAYAAWLMVRRAVFAPSGALRLEGSGSAWNPPTPALLKMFLLLILVVLSLQYLILMINHFRRLRQSAANSEAR